LFCQFATVDCLQFHLLQFSPIRIFLELNSLKLAEHPENSFHFCRWVFQGQDFIERLLWNLAYMVIGAHFLTHDGLSDTTFCHFFFVYQLQSVFLPLLDLLDSSVHDHVRGRQCCLVDSSEHAKLLVVDEGKDVAQCVFGQHCDRPTLLATFNHYSDIFLLM